MELLESALAFAAAMVILSTIATGVVEMLVRVLGMREQVLQQTIESLFQTIIWPRLGDALKGMSITVAIPQAPPAPKGNWEQIKTALANLFSSAPAADEAAAARTAFVRRMIGNPAFTDWQDVDPKRPVRQARRIDALSTVAFVERLAHTDVGRAIVAEGEEEIDRLVKDFSRSFERFGRASSEVFRKRAQMTAIVIGIIFAFAANIDAGRLVTRLIQDPDLRKSLIDGADANAAAAAEAKQRLDETNRLAAEGNLKPETLETLTKDVEKLIANVEATKSVGLPIGWNYYPYCADVAPTGDCAVPGFFARLRADWVEAVRWLLLTIVAGVLIGLGGPFWHRVFSSLSQVAQLLRAVGVSGARRPDAVAPEGAKPKGDVSAAPADLLDAFRVAADVHIDATRRAGG